MRDPSPPTELDLGTSERPARLLAFLFLALAPCPLAGHLFIPDPRRGATIEQVTELFVLYAVIGLLFSQMRWKSTDPRLVIAVPGLSLGALLGTVIVMGVSSNANDGATYLIGGVLIPISVGLTQRRGHATVAAALTVLGTVAIAQERSDVQLDQIVAFTCFVASAIAGETVAQGRHRYRAALTGLSQLALSTQRLSATESTADAWNVAAHAARELTNARAAAVVSVGDGSIDVRSASPALADWSTADHESLAAGRWEDRWTRRVASDDKLVTCLGAKGGGSELRLELLTQALSEHLMRLELVNRLQHEALSDALTGIGNRRAAMQELSALAPGDAIVLIDLDHFKQVNDVHGHDAGDIELQSLGTFLAQEVRRDDRVFRFGGEEFLMVLSGSNSAAFVTRIQAGWASRGQLTTLSAGHAVHRLGDVPQATLKRADEALYRAKNGGRNRVEFDA
jgi:diguanylate cyclase (GGDEF)-like protein